MDNETAPAFSWLPRLLQVSDSAFPTGGYAHSYGFEQIVRLGLVCDLDSMADYLECHLWPMLIHFELPVVRLAREAALNGNEAGLMDLDACLEATKTARELREASRALGRRRLHAFCATGPSPILTSFARLVDEGRCHAHHALVYGLATLPQQALLTSWAFQSISSICLSAPKLLRVGQDGVQNVLTKTLLPMEKNVRSSLSVRREELGWFDPLVELASMEHEIAYERLFIS